ncbi:MAG: protein arginine kinase [Candidatus Omnitrophica bacterium]|nr:protein arginine kinase [Candidatus Omnitrophota bacterium]MCB9747589.1 protein arginine kinase [Candidatus Omnitrophota bacterium]
MKLEDFIHNTGQWLKGTGAYANIVMSSRLRLARNLAKHPFPNKADKKELLAICETIKAAMDEIPQFKDSIFLKIQDLDNVDRQFLIERHLMSHEHAANPEGKALVVSKEEILSVMINEEDHMRIQVMESGFNLEEIWNVATTIDDELAKKLDFAYSMQWGYLTACPTNTGTAMRGSVMLHLPALVMTKQINKVLTAISKLNFASRGFYGEGTQASGNFYQISNQVSMGHSEQDVIQNINGLIRQVIEQEEQARQALLLQNKPMLEDKIFRSYGVLKNAHIISSQETVELLSMLRLGIDLQIIKDIDQKIINDLFIKIQPAHLQKLEGKKLNAADRDRKRASLIRQKIGGN